jgi:DNA-directed RNA polymerase subunit M/transcription elongation factor TFIIS
MFCKTCGTLLQLKKTDYGKWFACPNGHIQPKLEQSSVTHTQKNLNLAKPIEVTDDHNILAVHDHVCSKCGHTKAELIEISCSYSDEDNCYRMRCGKCKQIDILEAKLK